VADVSDIERDRSAMQFAITVTRSIEADYPDLAGVREGEATSDVLAAILGRLQRATGERDALVRLLEKIADECMTLDEVDVVWIGTQARLAVDRHRLGGES
jgi:hypothetical protein